MTLQYLYQIPMTILNLLREFIHFSKSQAIREIAVVVAKLGDSEKALNIAENIEDDEDKSEAISDITIAAFKSSQYQVAIKSINLIPIKKEQCETAQNIIKLITEKEEVTEQDIKLLKELITILVDDEKFFIESSANLIKLIKDKDLQEKTINMLLNYEEDIENKN